MMNEEKSVYELLGEKRLENVIHRFYSHVEVHPELAPIFPEDLTETKRKQIQFLTQFFGGPALYTEEHGHPMLRARHMPFPITAERRDAWLSCMGQALVEEEIEEPLRNRMFARLAKTADHMVNTSTEAGGDRD
ncbi:globin [Alkalicoccus urumqiensis]|nr:globin [Alkalicoccus urumqiensis]